MPPWPHSVNRLGRGLTLADIAWASDKRSMPSVYFVTHPDVSIDPALPVPDWRLSSHGLERMRHALALPWVAGIRAIWSSAERKARDGAGVLAEHLKLPVNELAELGENDRSATGYLPRSEFEALADEFFANPGRNVRGWERAIDAQRRIVAAVDHVLAASAGCDIAIVAHGGVGTLLLCALYNEEISRRHDQPPGNGGNYFSFDTDTRRLHHGWRRIDE